MPKPYTQTTLPMTRCSSELYDRARGLIPTGTMLLSKRPDNLAPGVWPAYYKRAWGNRVEDVDGNVFVDFTGDVGATLLGRADPDVNTAVKAVVDQGNFCLLNVPQEVELAELLTQIIPCAEQARFCRGGGEADAMAVRIARGHTGRDKIAFCGYHGWHDWYLAANLGDSSTLDGHLLPGLQPLGVPRALAGTAQPFAYNDLDSLKKLLELSPGQFAAVIMEATRFHQPEEGFLAGVRALATEHGAVLIFDEVVTGFRMALGGAQEYFGVTPDLAVFAKTISNGYPMGAVVGRRKVMNAVNDLFISSTYWTDAIGSAAALASIRKIQRANAIEHVWTVGRRLKEGLRTSVKASGIGATVKGWPPVVLLSFEHESEETARAMKTFFTRHLLAQGFLSTGCHYLTLAHTIEDAEVYLAAVGRALEELSASLENGRLMEDIGHNPCRPHFKRLT